MTSPNGSQVSLMDTPYADGVKVSPKSGRAMTASGTTAVMARRREPVDSLDFFPTPPWATRALMRYCLPLNISEATVWEPAAGEGHMAEILREGFAEVIASDVHDYGKGYEVGSFVGEGLDVAPIRAVDWVITNPPFNLAGAFAERAIREAGAGAALLLRTSWLEGGERYREIFSKMPPSQVAIFSERVPMVAKRWDPEAASATSYAWFIWRHPLTIHTRLMWIPPGQRDGLERPDDRRRFCKVESAPLLESP